MEISFKFLVILAAGAAGCGGGSFEGPSGTDNTEGTGGSAEDGTFADGPSSSTGGTEAGSSSTGIIRTTNDSTGGTGGTESTGGTDVGGSSDTGGDDVGGSGGTISFGGTGGTDFAGGTGGDGFGASGGTGGDSSGGTGSGGIGGDASGGTSGAGGDGTGGTGCIPQPCPANHCGIVSDSCGGTVQCDTQCSGLWGEPDPNLCGVESPNGCSACEPLSDEDACEFAGAECGQVPNGCLLGDGSSGLYQEVNCNFLLPSWGCGYNKECQDGQCAGCEYDPDDSGVVCEDLIGVFPDGVNRFVRRFEYYCEDLGVEPNPDDCSPSGTAGVWCCDYGPQNCRLQAGDTTSCDSETPWFYQCVFNAGETFSGDVPSGCVEHGGGYGYCCPEDAE